MTQSTQQQQQLLEKETWHHFSESVQCPAWVCTQKQKPMYGQRIVINIKTENCVYGMKHKLVLPSYL